MLGEVKGSARAGVRDAQSCGDRTLQLPQRRAAAGRETDGRQLCGVLHGRSWLCAARPGRGSSRGTNAWLPAAQRRARRAGR